MSPRVSLPGRLALFGEKIAWTVGEQFIVVWLASSGGLLVTHRYVVAIDSALFAGLVCLVTSLITTLTPLVDRLTGWRDVGVRGALTFLQSFSGTMLTAAAAPSVLHADWRGALLVAVPVTITAVGKSVLALRSASFEASTVSPVVTGASG